jgi:hypothetical protein
MRMRISVSVILSHHQACAQPFVHGRLATDSCAKAGRQVTDQVDGGEVAFNGKGIVAIRRVLHALAHRILRPRGILRATQLKVASTLVPRPLRRH